MRQAADSTRVPRARESTIPEIARNRNSPRRGDGRRERAAVRRRDRLPETDPDPVGIQVEFVAGEGPRIANPVRTAADVAALSPSSPSATSWTARRDPIGRELGTGCP
jgi:hypothetical protein